MSENKVAESWDVSVETLGECTKVVVVDDEQYTWDCFVVEYVTDELRRCPARDVMVFGDWLQSTPLGDEPFTQHWFTDYEVGGSNLSSASELVTGAIRKIKGL